MDIEVLREKENKLLRRIELDILIKHFNSGTPKRSAIRELIASKFNVDIDRVYVIKLTSEYGAPITKGHIHIYNSKDTAIKIEPSYILNRHMTTTQKA